MRFEMTTLSEVSVGAPAQKVSSVGVEHGLICQIIEGDIVELALRNAHSEFEKSISEVEVGDVG